MPRIDPDKLLSCLIVLLAPNGGIKSTNEVRRLADLMHKYSKKLVSKCIYIQILKSTKTELLEQFMSAGGWNLTHTWFDNGILTHNWPLVKELLELLLLCPVDTVRLKTNSAPKLVKNLSKDGGGNEDVRILATRLVEQWLKVVKSETAAAQAQAAAASSGLPANANSTVAITSTPTVIVAPPTATTTTTTTAAAATAAIITNKLQEQNNINVIKKSIVFVPTSNVTTRQDKIEEDPLAIPTTFTGTITTIASIDTSNSNKTITSDLGVQYKLTVKDGKQIFTRVENNNVTSANQTNNSTTTTSSTNIISPSKVSTTDTTDNVVEEKSVFVKTDDNKISDKLKDKENVRDKDASDKNRDSKKDKERDRDRNKDRRSSSSSSSKSKDRRSGESSSTHHHRSSSSTSGSKSSSSSKHNSSSSSSKSKTSSSSSSSNSSKGSSSSSSNRDKLRDKDRHRSSGSSKSSSSSSSSSRDKERERDRDRERNKSSDSKDNESLSSKLGKITKKVDASKSPSSSTTSSNSSDSAAANLKKQSISIEVRNRDIENRPKTVKTFHSQFRSHGLAEEAPPPPSRRGLKKPAPISIPGTAIPSSIVGKRSSPPPSSSLSSNDKDYLPEKKLKLDVTITPEEKPGGVKLIPAKPKPSVLMESDMFMDALSAATTKKDGLKKRKRKLSGKDSDLISPTGEKQLSGLIKTTESAGGDKPKLNSPTRTPAAPLKFYQDTLEEDTNVSVGGGGVADSKDDIADLDDIEIDIQINSDDKDTDNEIIENGVAGTVADDDADVDDEGDDDDENISLSKLKSKRVKLIDKPIKKIEPTANNNNTVDDNESIITNNSDKDNDNIDEPRPPGPGCPPNGPPSVLTIHRRKGPKKQLKWKPQEELEEIRYFELDETERINVTKTFVDMKQMERYSERDAFLMARKLNVNDTMVEQTVWKPLILIEDVPSHPSGANSKERKIQAEREQSCLKALYFNRLMIPNSPAEPDMEQYQLTEPQIIPLEDITGNPDAINDFTNFAYPEPRGSPPHGSSSSSSSSASSSSGQLLLNHESSSATKSNIGNISSNSSYSQTPSAIGVIGGGGNSSGGSGTSGSGGVGGGGNSSSGVGGLVNQSLQNLPFNPFTFNQNLLNGNIGGSTTITVNTTWNQQHQPMAGGASDGGGTMMGSQYMMSGQQFHGNTNYNQMPPSHMMGSTSVPPPTMSNDSFNHQSQNQSRWQQNGPSYQQQQQQQQQQHHHHQQGSYNYGGINSSSNSNSNNNNNNNNSNINSNSNNGPNNHNNNWYRLNFDQGLNNVVDNMNNNNNSNSNNKGGGNTRPSWLNPKRICKSFAKGYCRHGDKCNFLHPGINCPSF